MPDLRSELKKLENLKFDDEPTTPLATSTPEAPRTTLRRTVWEFIRDNPSSDSTAAAAKLGMKQSAASAHLKHLFDAGMVERVDHGGTYFYIVSDKEYPNLSRVELIAAGRAKGVANSMKARKAKAKKAKVSKRAKQGLDILKQAAEGPSLAEKKAAFMLPKPEFDPDAILAGLNVLQAKQLLAKLNQLFAV